MRSGFTSLKIPPRLIVPRPETPEQEAALAIRIAEATAEHGVAPVVVYS